jgi:hypothetical protein
MSPNPVSGPDLTGAELTERLATTALRLAASGGWAAVDLPAVAAAAVTPLSELQGVAGTPRLAALIDRWLDATVASAALDLTASPRERLFEALMRRLEAMEDHRAGVLAWREGLARDPSLWAQAAHSRMATARWVLACTGLDGGVVREAQAIVVAGILLRAERGWVQDSDGSFTRTMASLDRDLREAERRMQQIEGWLRPRARPEPPAAAPAGQEEPTAVAGA